MAETNDIIFFFFNYFELFESTGYIRILFPVQFFFEKKISLPCMECVGIILEHSHNHIEKET